MSCVAATSVPRVAPRAADARRRRADRVASRTRSGIKATTAEASAVDVGSIEDAWIAGSLERCAVGGGVQGLREGAVSRLATSRMPTQRVEEYRFTDLAPLVAAQVATGKEAAHLLVGEAARLQDVQSLASHARRLARLGVAREEERAAAAYARAGDQIEARRDGAADGRLYLLDHREQVAPTHAATV